MQALVEGYRLSPQQRQVWQWQLEVAGFRLQGSIKIEGPLQMQLLSRAWAEVLQRHEILRTAFRRLPGMELPLQVILDEAAVDLEVTDLSELESTEQQRKLEVEMDQQQQQEFKLEQGRVVQARVVRLSEERHVLLVTLSALCGDRQSLQNLVTELAHSYAAQQQDEVLQYADYCAWQQELLSTEEGVEAGAYWEREVERAGAAVTLPGELKGSAGAGPAQVEQQVGQEVRDKLVALGERAGVSVSEVLMGTWQTLLWRLSGAQEIRIECEFSGRKYAELSAAIGPFAKCLPVAVRVEREETLVELLQKVGRLSKEQGRREEYFREAKREAREGGPENRGIGFEYLQLGEGAATAAGVKFALGAVRSWTAPLKLKLSCVDEGTGVRLQVSYDTNSYSASAVERLLASLVTLLESLSATGTERVGRLPVLNAR